MAKKVLYVATVVKTHIMQFHTPFLKMCKELGWETAVAARNDYEDPADCNIPFCDAYFDVPFRRNPLGKENLSAYRRLKQIIREGNYDIIHCHTPMGGVLTRLAARKARKQGAKVIYTAHGFHFFKGAPILNWLVYYPVEWLLAHLTDVLITINREDDALARKHMHAKEVLYIPGVGIDLSKYNFAPIDTDKKKKEIGVPSTSKTILSVGELIPRKNHKIIIQALSQLVDPHIHYIIVGSGAIEGELRQFAEQKGVSQKVHFLGYRSDVDELCHCADVFCFPSINEGLPVALMEAMACGIPVVCSDIRGNRDLIQDGVSGYLVSQKAEDYAEKIQILLSNEKLRSKMSSIAGKSLNGFQLESIVEKMRECYFPELEKDGGVKENGC